ncbi:Uma2 family endonuclease [Longispora albida]|uniref:Uma2 family endonuclease n=1 Tax=Longispora albida TaxID=203523 RepID=UPI001FE0B2A9|nr:Uma2 family endonuclease [Longispora albida]
MTASPAERLYPAPWAPDPIRQRLANYTVEDVLAFPEDAPRVELAEGKVIVVPAPTPDHQDIAGLVWHWLRRHAPKQFRATMATGVMVSASHTFEPDVLLIDAEAPGNRHYQLPEQVELAIEVVSPSTRRQDRITKPAEYAAAGIPCYWRIEQNPLHIYAYQLAGQEYQLVADSAGELVIEAPFPIRLPISEITP